MRRHTDTILNALVVAVLLTAVAVLLWPLLEPSIRGADERPPVETVSGLTIPADEITHVRGIGRVALVEFSDFECPFCARHARTTAREIDEQLVRTGVIRHVFFNFPLARHARGQDASEAVECAARQGQFWEMHARLFEPFSSLERDHLLERARSLPLDFGAFTACLESGTAAPDVRRDVEIGKRLRVRRTPAFFIGVVADDGAITIRSHVKGALPFWYFKILIDEVQPVRAAHAKEP